MDNLSTRLGGLRLNGSQLPLSVSELLALQPSAEHLSKLVDVTQGLSCGPSQNALQVQLGLQTIDSGRGDPLEALHHLSECHSTTLRQYMIWKSSCRLHQLQVKAGRRVPEEGWPAGTQEALLDLRRRLLQHSHDPDRRQEMLNIIGQVPPEWTVVQLTAVPRARTRRSRLATPELVVARFNGGAPESLVLARVPPPVADDACTFRAEFEAILADNTSIQKSLHHDRQQYWAQRRLLDERMKSIVKNMETAWLGRLAYLVSGGVTCPEQQRLIEEALSSLPASVPATQRARLSVLCSRPPNTDAEFAAAVRDALQGTPLQPAVLKRVTHKLTARRPALRVAALSSSRSGQVILILDKEVQQYPWEMVGPLAKGPVCRLPSLAILGLSLAGRPASALCISANKSKGTASVATHSATGESSTTEGAATYILNPAGDLTNTEQRMGPFLEAKGWRGIVGRPPTLEEFASALTDGQIMAYCGHGSGSQYLPTEKLRSLSCNAVALLFGCGSGQLLQPGPTADPHGNVHAYLMANCPAILGNLWSVTDSMLDTYSKAVIDKWTGADGERSPSLPEAAAAARSSVTSAFMAAAPVVYGLPVTTDTQTSA